MERVQNQNRNLNKNNQERIIVENNVDNRVLNDIKTVLEDLLFTTENQRVEWNDRELGRMVTAVGRS